MSKSEKVMKIFARGENQPNLFTIHFYFLLPVHIGDAMPIEKIPIGGKYAVKTGTLGCITFGRHEEHAARIAE